MGNSEIIALLLPFVLTCAQYEDINSFGGSRSTPTEVIHQSDSSANTTATRASNGYPASANNLYPNTLVPIAFPPFQEDPSYPHQQPQLYPLIIPGNGTEPTEPVYLAMFPMKLIYDQRYQDQQSGQSKSSYTPTSDDNTIADPIMAYPNNPSDPSKPSYRTDPYNPSTSYNNDSSYPATASYPTEPSYSSAPTYHQPPTDPSEPDYHQPPTDPSTNSYPNPPSGASPPLHAANPSYPSTTTYPNNSPYPTSSYSNTSSHPNQPSPQKDPAYSETPHISDTPSNPTHLDQPPQEYSYHGVKPPAKMYPCAGYLDGKAYGVRDVCFAYFECTHGESLYRQCDDHYRFDETSGQCVADISCLSACPEQWKPHPTDIYKFILGGKEMSCPYGTFFDYKICSCQSKNNLPHDYR